MVGPNLGCPKPKIDPRLTQDYPRLTQDWPKNVWCWGVKGGQQPCFWTYLDEYFRSCTLFYYCNIELQWIFRFWEFWEKCGKNLGFWTQDWNPNPRLDPNPRTQDWPKINLGFCKPNTQDWKPHPNPNPIPNLGSNLGVHPISTPNPRLGYNLGCHHGHLLLVANAIAVAIFVA